MVFKNLSILIAIFCCLQSNHLYGQPTQLLNRSFGEQYAVLDSIYNSLHDKDSSGAIGQMILLQSWANDKGDKQLAYSFELMKYRYRIVKRGKNNDAAEQELLDFIARMKAEKHTWLEVNAMVLLAGYYWNDYNKCAYGFDNALRAYDIYSGASDKEFPPKKQYLFSLGVNYMRFKEYSGARKYMVEALNTTSSSEDPRDHNILNAIGLSYRNMGMYDSAELYFNKAYNSAVKENNTTWESIISGNMGINYYLEGRYREAIPLIEKEIANYKKPNVNTAKSLAILGDIYLIQNDKKKGLELILQAYQIIKDRQKWGDYEVLQIIYTVLAKAYAANNNTQLAYTYMDSAMMAKDSVASQKNVLKIATVQQKQEHEKYEAEVQKLADQKKLHIVIRNSLIGGILLLAIISILFINRQRLKNNQREQKLLAEKKMAEAEKKLAENELHSASRQLSDFTRSIYEKNELIEKFSTEIERLQALPCSVELPDTRQNLEKLQQSTILTEEQWEDFRSIFEKVHTGFFNRLKEKLPDLSPAEIRFVALSKLNLNNKEMAGMLGISTDAVRMNRHRLKKKLNLQEEDSLEKLIEMI